MHEELLMRGLNILEIEIQIIVIYLLISTNIMNSMVNILSHYTN